MISKEKLIVRISGFGKNSVSKFWKNKKLNVLDMGYTLTTFEYYCDVMDEKGKIIAFMNDRFPAGKTETEG